MIIKRPAVKVTQGKLIFFATSFKVSHLIQQNFYRVDKLDVDNSQSGFQRVLDENRAKRLAKYLSEGVTDGDAFLPTSVLLATDKTIPYDEATHEISIDLSTIGSFNVVDGQHRIEGLIIAAKENPRVLDFEISANIAIELDDVNQMCHFLIVNTTQKSVDKSVEQQIVARLTSMIDIKDIPTLPKWIRRQVVRGEDREALLIANYLNTEKDSPWFGKIKMANETKDGTSIEQKSFVQSTKMYLLTSSNPLNQITDFNKRNHILKNYWIAIASLLTIPDTETVIFKTIGLEIFNLISPTIFQKLLLLGSFTVGTFKNELSKALENLPTEYQHLRSAEWWIRGHGASDLNKSAARKIANELNKAITAKESGEIEV